MKHLFARVTAGVKAVVQKVPASVRSEVTHVVLTFVGTFVMTAAPAVPHLWNQLKLGHAPSFTVVHALVAASSVAAFKTAVPVARAAFFTLIPQFFANRRAAKAAKFMAAVEAYVAAHPQDPTAPRGAVS